MELFLDVLAESLVDTAKMLPFLFLAYLFIEYVETRHGERIETLLAGGGRWGAVPGAVLGCVPQCGFSAIASNFYASRVITLGTLMAVYLATSDEAIPLLVSMPAYWDKLALLMVIKVVYAIFVGFMLDFVLRKALPRSLRGGYTGRADEVDCHEEHSDEQGQPQPIWKAALRHTLEIFVFIFAFSLVFGLIVEGVGEDVFAAVLGRMGFFQPVMAALVGLVPNCAASVLLTQLYVEGALRFSSLVAGLCTGAGVGLAVLWRANPSWKQNLFITGLTWACGAAVGVSSRSWSRLSSELSVFQHPHFFSERGSADVFFYREKEPFSSQPCPLCLCFALPQPGLRHPASASCSERHLRLAGRGPNSSFLFPPLAAVRAVAPKGRGF